MELKTLKDFFCGNRKGLEGSRCENCDYNHTVTEEYLKQEAIKWVRELEIEIEQIKKIPEVYLEFRKNPILIRGEVSHTIRWIKHFFNIRGGDLK